MCDVFDVHRSSYKYWQLRDTSLSVEEVRLRAEVKSAHELSGGSAGARTIAEIVTQRGFHLSRYRATRFRTSELPITAARL